MRWVFALALILGMLSLIGWSMLHGKRAGRSDQKSQTRTPRAIAAAVTFGMGGLSASYAGWSLGLAIVVATAAAALAAWYAGTVTAPGGEGRD